jgi:hypothetical protein
MSASDTMRPLISAPWLNSVGNPLSVIPLPGLREEVIQSLECSYPGILSPTMKDVVGAARRSAAHAASPVLSSAVSILPVAGSSKSPTPYSGPRSPSPSMVRSGVGLRKSATETYRVRFGVCILTRKSLCMSAMISRPFWRRFVSTPVKER